ncbi:DUF1707 SHOCT-like domain-containing protein [Geodermatophilus sp. SYSU D00700]
MDGSRAPHPAPPLRASDGDRAATVQALQDAVARGLLTPDEGSDRMASAFAAVHLRDLAPLTADLPPATAPSGPPGWRPLGLMAWEQVRATLHGARSDGPTAVRLALVAVLTLLLFVALGSLVLQGLFDGGPERWSDGWPEGWGERPGPD